MYISKEIETNRTVLRNNLTKIMKNEENELVIQKIPKRKSKWLQH